MVGALVSALKKLEVEGLVCACAWNCDSRKLQQSFCNSF